MQTITNKKYFGPLAAAAILIAPLVGIASTATAQHGTAGTVSDATSNMVRSDGGGIYQDGIECVSVGTAGNGWYQLRTVQNAGVCNGERSWWSVNPPIASPPLPYIPGQGYHRFLTLDFSARLDGPVSPGNLDGSNALNPGIVQYAPVRFIFENAFKNRATTTPVGMFVLYVDPNTGATTQDTAWDIEYVPQAVITPNPNGSKTLTLPPNSASAKVYHITYTTVHGRTTSTSTYVGTYDLPFSVTTN